MNPTRLVDLDAERAVLANVILSAGASFAALDALGIAEAVFGDSRHGTIWAAFRALHQRGVPVDIITLGAELRAMERAHTVGGAQYLAELTDYIPSLAHTDAHAGVVMDIARLRLAAEKTQEMFSVLAQGGRSQEVLERVHALAREIPTGHVSHRDADIGVHFDEAWARVLADIRMRAEGKAVCARFGIDALDGDERWLPLLGGIFRQNILTLSGAPGGGKTTLALCAAIQTSKDAMRRVNFVRNHAARVLIFATEMRGPQVALRLACAAAGVDFKKLRMGTASKEERPNVHAAGKGLAELPIDIIDTKVNGGSISADDVRRHTVSACARGEVALVVVDYFQDLAPCRDMTRASVTEEQEQRAKRLHDVAVDSDVPMIVVSSMNKTGQRGHQEGHAGIADTRGAGLDYASDVLGFIYLADPKKAEASRLPHAPPATLDDVVFKVVKNRYGAMGKITLEFDKLHGTFRGKVVANEDDDAPPDMADDPTTPGGFV